MDKTSILGILKLVAAGLALGGIVLTEADMVKINAGWLTVHSILSAVQAKFTKDK